MKTNFFKVAALIAMGAVTVLSSCSKEDEAIGNENLSSVESLGKEIIIEDLTDEEFDRMVEFASQNPEFVEYSVVEPDNEQLRDAAAVGGNQGEVLVQLLGYVSSRKNHIEFNGYQRLGVDLNKKAGGDYVYLYAKFGVSSNGINKITGHVGCMPPGEYVKNTSGYVLDCNSGTRKGNHITLGVERGSNPIKKLFVMAVDSRCISPQFECGGLDLNKGAGGDYIYIGSNR